MNWLSAVSRADRRLVTSLFAGVCIAIMIAGPLAACGKKGDPEPPDETSQFPRTYPRN